MGALSNAPSTGGEQALRDFTSLLESLGIELDESALADLFGQLQLATQTMQQKLSSQSLGALSNQQVTAETTAQTMNGLVKQLESLDIKLNQEEIAELFAQLQTAEQGTPEPLIALAAAATDNTLDMPSPALQEISSRLTLVAAFTDDTGLPSPTTIQTTSVAAIAEQLAIGKKDAIALINAYQQLSGSTGSNGSAQRPETLSQQIAALSLGNFANTDTSTQQTTSNTLAAPTMQTMATSVHVSSEAMASALAVSGASGETAARISGGNELAFNLPAPQPIAAATGASLPSSIATPVSHPAWPSQLGQQLIQLVQRGGEQHVQMKLHPAELGPLSISLKMTEHGAQAQFLSAHAQVRQVIEQAIPQLREALAEQGISLSDTSVGEQGFSNQQEAFAQQSTGSSAGGESGVTSVEGETGTPASVGSSIALDGRVDLYA
ncbi:flagellar hook-length control protein FliK [Halomonas aquamarina]|jgi:flagellar hook-length control protein FliK|nr:MULTISPECIES: flagellar hook-length control protein FliK [Halomonas]MCC4291592.1 flagellar hook-length control protein FliK [Halomonas axialensis]MCD1652400.1 flagellar hook-length control protein FliK [Halomonas axialensis]MCD2088717.1 flagellar hook-length control protein FliK [Halomonas meridiana]MCF2911540.1 flagellar hook-length control protein FliK [Halomonas sp. Cn5-12]MDC8442048.1 flagellar hook-length control protein FliK [Halomonas aquamarina]